jgi:hypothetical protein
MNRDPSSSFRERIAVALLVKICPVATDLATRAGSGRVKWGMRCCSMWYTACSYMKFCSMWYTACSYMRCCSMWYTACSYMRCCSMWYTACSYMRCCSMWYTWGITDLPTLSQHQNGLATVSIVRDELSVLRNSSIGCNIMRSSLSEIDDVSEEHVDSVFRVQEFAKLKPGWSKA